MVTFTKLARELWRDYMTEGVPASGAHQPVKADIRQWGLEVEYTLSIASTAGASIAKSTKSSLDADLLHAADAMAWVYADATAQVNGIYRKVGGIGSGSWSRIADLPYGLIPLNVTGGTTDAIVAISSYPIPTSDRSVLVTIVPSQSNFGAVTIAINGAAPIPLLDGAGAPLSAGSLAPGRPVLMMMVNGSMRLIGHANLAASVASAAASASAASASASAAELSASRVDLGQLDIAVSAAVASSNQALVSAASAASARDATFANAGVYSDIATGLAAVTNGAQFMVASADEIVRYRRDSPTTQTRIASYPTSAPKLPVVLSESRTIGSTDSGRVFVANMPSIPNVPTIGHIRLPSNSVDPVPIGTLIECVRVGGASVKFVPDKVGAAVISAPPNAALVGDMSWSRVLKTGPDAWMVYGDLGSAPASALTAKVWLDPSDLSTLRQEITGALAQTPAAVNAPVGSARNKGTIGGWFSAVADSRRPILRNSGSFYWLEFDGIDDYIRLQLPAIPLTTIEMYVGVRIINWVSPQSGIVTLAPTYEAPTYYQDFNSNFSMAPLYINGADHSFSARGGQTTSFVMSLAGIMKKPSVIEFRKVANASASMTVSGALAISDTTIPDVFGVQSGDLIVGARAGNGVNSFGNFELYNLTIANEVAADPVPLRTYMESKTTGVQPQYPSIATSQQLSDARSTLISQVFSTVGGVLPVESATLAVESPHPLNGIITVANLAQCERLTIPGYASRPRLWTPNNTRSDAVFLLCSGHDVGLNANGLVSVAMQSILNIGMPVCTFVLPGGPNELTAGDPGEHEAQRAPLSDWVGPVVIAINALLSRYPGAQVYICGISGGGWMANISGACDVRIKGTYQFVGTIPDYFYMNRDWEQRLPGLTADYMTLYLLGACPAGRRHKHVLYENDPVGFNRTTYNTRHDWSVSLSAQAAGLGGDYDLVWVNHNAHAFQNPSFINEVVAEMPARP